MNLFNLESLIATIGYLGVFAIVFAESGLFIGFFLPGDSLLFTSGFLAAQGFYDIRILVIGCFIAAVLGDSVGYLFGHKVGRRFFEKKDSLFFHHKNLMRAEKFYEKHGKKTIIIARFMPVVRTFAPIVAGIGKMDYKTFLTYNVIGGVLWGVGLTVAGYFLGSLVPDIDQYLLPIIGLIIFLSVLPALIHFFKDSSYRKNFTQEIKRVIKGKEKII
ncbi:MAG: DedA family protein [Patescibacteria group bacterium]